MPTNDYSGRFHTPSLQAGTRRITTHRSVRQSAQARGQRVPGLCGLATARARSRCGDETRMPCGCGAAKLARPVAAQAQASPIRNSLKPVRSSWTRLKTSRERTTTRRRSLPWCAPCIHSRGGRRASVRFGRPPRHVDAHRPARACPTATPAPADRPPAWTRAGPHSAAWPRTGCPPPPRPTLLHSLRHRAVPQARAAGPRPAQDARQHAERSRTGFRCEAALEGLEQDRYGLRPEIAIDPLRMKTAHR